MIDLVTVFCGNGQCGERLGVVAMSGVQSRMRPVWKIEPGWWFSDRKHLHLGVLEQTDYTFRSERELYEHLTSRPRAMQGVGVGREVSLPVIVRCPKCHSKRTVPPDIVFSSARLGAGRSRMPEAPARR
jgi:hypothetical protein